MDSLLSEMRFNGSRQIHQLLFNIHPYIEFNQLLHLKIGIGMRYLETRKINQKSLFVVFFLMISMAGYAQDFGIEKPDYSKIKKAISEKSSKLYYPVLMQRFIAADTLMTLKEKRHLYYGYRYQSSYSPYDSSEFVDSLYNKLDSKQELNDADLDMILNYADLILLDDPFNIRAMNYQVYVFSERGNEAALSKCLFKINTILDVLFSSGDGLDKENAIYVINTRHEYDFLNVLGLVSEGQALIDHFDYLSLQENELKLEGLYFDISPCLEYLNIMFK